MKCGIGVNRWIIVPANDASHGKPKEAFGIYYSDYLHIADKIDFGKPYLWD